MLHRISGNDTVSSTEQHRADKNLHEGKEKTMKQLRTRLLSAALAACMAVSVLPVSALALGGGIDSENDVSAQAQTGVRLNGGDIIDDTTITSDGVY